MKLRIRLGKDSRRDDRWITFSLCCLIFIPSINNFLNSVLQIGLSIHLEFLTPVSYIFMAFMSVFVLYKYVITRTTYLTLLLLTLMGVAVSYLLYPEIRSDIYSSPVDLVYSPVNKLIFFCIPALAGTASLTDHGALFEKMRTWSKLTAVLGIITFAFVHFYVGVALQYMVYSYFMLISICVCFEHAICKHAVSDWVIAILGTACIVMCGARGAVVSLAMYFAVRVLTSLRKHETRGRIIQSLCVFIFVLMVMIFYKELLLLGIAVCEKLGINSRFLTALYEGELIEDRSRARLAGAALRSLADNPIGYGLFGDRYAVGRFGYLHAYVHNIFLEILCDFGIICGTVIIVAAFWRLIKTVHAIKNTPALSLLQVLMPYGVYQLFFSSSYLENTILFMIMGMIFCVNWKNNMDVQTGRMS